MRKTGKKVGGHVGNQEHMERPDYSKRNRKFEWRSQWFHLQRTENEYELIRQRKNALQRKGEMIKQQRETADHLAAYAPAGPGTPWFSIGPRNVNGRVKSLAVHPSNENIVYAGAASGGIWKSDDGGQSWRPLWDQQESLAVGAIAIAPGSSNIIYAGTGEGVIADTYGSGHNFPGAGVYVSTNDGATWTQRSAVVNRRITRVLVSHTDAQRIFVAGQSGLNALLTVVLLGQCLKQVRFLMLLSIQTTPISYTYVCITMASTKAQTLVIIGRC